MLNLKFEHVRAFLHVVRQGGNKKAANALHLTEPAITARLRNLEALLGTELFDKTPGGIRRLSRRGEMLFHHAEKLEHLVNQIEHDVVETKSAVRFLRVGAAETVAQSWMPNTLLELRKRFPMLELELVVDISPRLLELLDKREIDIAVAHGRTGDQRINRIALPPVELLWFTSSEDPIEDIDAARSLFNKPVITFPRNTLPFREMRDAVWSKVGSDVQIFPSSSLHSALQMVVAGVGVSAFPRFLSNQLVEQKLISQFDPGWAPNPLKFAIHHFADPANPTAANAVDLMIEAATREFPEQYEKQIQ